MKEIQDAFSASGKIILYRFLPAEYAILALQSQKMKLGRIFELNDPYDCYPQFIDQEDSSQFRPFSERLLENWRGRQGIASFSKSINDPVLWSHYADSHRGIALGFVFEENDSNLFEVLYPPENKRAIITDDEIQGLFSADEFGGDSRSVIQKCFCTKANSWAYEVEYRLFFPLHKCEMSALNYFYKMPVSRLFSVTLGEKCTVTGDDIEHILYENPPTDYPEIVLRQKACLDRDSYDLRINSLL